MPSPADSTDQENRRFAETTEPAEKETVTLKVSDGAQTSETVLDYLKRTAAAKNTQAGAPALEHGLPSGPSEEADAQQRSEAPPEPEPEPEHGLPSAIPADIGDAETPYGFMPAAYECAGAPEHKLPAKEDAVDSDLQILLAVVIVCMFVSICAAFTTGPGAPDEISLWNAMPILAWAGSLFFTCSILKKKFNIVELSPVKAGVATCLAVFPPWYMFGVTKQLLDPMYFNLTPMRVIIPLYADLVVVTIFIVCYFLFWQLNWITLIGKRLYAIEHFEVLRERAKPKMQLIGLCCAINLGLLFYRTPPIMAIWMIAGLLYITLRACKILPKWQQMDLPSKYQLGQMVRLQIGNKKHQDKIVVKYRSFAGVERWFKDRFKERSWKKGLIMASLGVAFFGLNGPTYLVQLITFLLRQFSFGGAQAAANAAALSSANQSAIFTLLSMLSWPFVIGAITYMTRPTHLELSAQGVRFLWRHTMFRLDGKKVPWSKVDEIQMERPFGKTLPQDFSLRLLGAGKILFKAKLACIATMDDKAAVLNALDQWAKQTSRSADVTELLRPPADHSYTELWLQALTAPPKRERLKPLVPGILLKNSEYQVQNQIGAGGQGFAYLATEIGTSKKVVLKEYILPVFVDLDSRRSAVERFEREARTLSALDFSGVVELLDFFIEDHRAYLVLEHIEGESLKQLVERSGPLSETDTVRLGQQMCTILSYLHGLIPPLVHRDFTPDNLILRPDGTLKLIDFNVAQQTESTFTGSVVGKHSYLPPEQFRGAAVPQSDIYALGATLFYLLVGHDPEPISASQPCTERPEISKELDDLVLKSTALKLERRFADVAEVEAKFAEILPVIERRQFEEMQ